MRTAASPARPDHDTSHRGSAAARAIRALPRLCLAAIAGYGGMTAFAQGEVACTAIANDAERLACYDKALRPAAPAPATVPAPAARTPEPAPAPAPAAARAAPAAPRAGAPADDGIVPIVVVGMRALPGRETTFTTEDGAAWVQTDSQRLVGLPDTPFAAEIRRGSMNSYFLVPKERGRAIRVRLAR